MTRLFMEPINIETERLRLRQWLPVDRGPFAALNADPKVMAHFPAPLDRSTSDALADRCEKLIAERGYGFWAVERKDQSRFIGFVGLHRPVATLPFAPCIEIGWRLAREHWRQGFATEAAFASLRDGFERLGLTEIVSFTPVGNKASRAVMRRIGMTEDAQTFEHPSISEGHPLREHSLYRLNVAQWKAWADIPKPDTDCPAGAT